MIRLLCIGCASPGNFTYDESVTRRELPVFTLSEARNSEEARAFPSGHAGADLIFWDPRQSDWPWKETELPPQGQKPVLVLPSSGPHPREAVSLTVLGRFPFPISGQDFIDILKKYEHLRHHFISRISFPLAPVVAPRRLIAQEGEIHHILDPDTIVLFGKEGKGSMALDQHGKTYFLNQNLSRLECELDAGNFFRANRQHLVNLRFIRSFRVLDKGRIQVDLSSAEGGIDIPISQENAQAFRRWVSRQ